MFKFYAYLRKIELAYVKTARSVSIYEFQILDTFMKVYR